MKTICIIAGLLFSVGTRCQNWLPLDKGIGHTWAGITDIFPDTSNNLIYITGSFTEDGNNISMRGMAKWDGVKWDSVGDANSYNATKLGICKYHDTLIISGLFQNHAPYNENLAKLNGSIWDTIPNTESLNAISFAEKNGILYFGGGFNKVGNDSTFGLGKYDGTNFSGLTPCYEVNGSIMCSMAFFQDTLYVGGVFYLYPQLPIAGFAKWDGYNLLNVSPEFVDNTCIVEAMAVYNNELYIGGEFYKSYGFTSDCIMKWDGHQFTEVGTGGGANQRVTCMKVYKNELYVGGWFTQIGGIVSKNIAKWDGSQWTSLNIDDFDYSMPIRDICIFNNELYVAGYFRKIGNDSIASVAKYNHSLSIKNTSEINRQISIFPNPATSYTTIKTCNNMNMIKEVEIYTIEGKMLKQYTFSQNKITINTSQLSAGMYIIEVQTSKNKMYQKLLISH